MPRKSKSAAAVILTVLCLACPWSHAYGAENGTWELSDNGKHWMYFYSPDDPVKDQWIEDQGKEYYVDSQGYMKTGWVTDKRDGNRYYMGEDGAKAYNRFTPDDRYVGPDGVELTSFDTYRRAMKKQLSSVMRDKGYQAGDAGNLPGFLLIDLNRDGYEDAVAVDHADHPGRVVMTAVWEPEDETLVLSSEADLKGEGASWLSYNQDTQVMWLVSDGGAGRDKDYFFMDKESSSFEDIWHFTTQLNQWGDPVYYVNGSESGREGWNQALLAAQQTAGTRLSRQFIPLDKEHIKQAVDRAPEPEELLLWEP